MPLPLQATLTYTASAGGGLTQAQLATLMAGVVLYSAPPPNASQLPVGTSDAVLDVLMGASVFSDTTMPASGDLVTRTIILNLRPAAGAPVAASFVSLGNAGSASAPTNNPPFPSPLFPFASLAAGAASAWTGSVVSSSPADSNALGAPAGAKQLEIFYQDTTGTALHEIVDLAGTTPVNLVNANKYILTEVRIIATGASGAAPLGKVNVWSGPVDPVTGLPTGILVGYLPNSYFTNFSFQQLTSWTVLQVADVLQANQLVPPDFNYPDQTVITPPPPLTVPAIPPPPPSKYLYDYPPPSSIVNPGLGQPSTVLASPSAGLPLPQAVLNVASTAKFPATGVLSLPTSKGLQQVAYTGVTAMTFTGCTGGTGTLSVGSIVTAQFAYPYVPNFTNPNEYLSSVFYGGASFVPNPFQGAGLGAIANALNMPISQVISPGTVSMAVTFA